MQLTSRQKEITRIVRENGPITGEMIAERLHVTRSALRGDLAVLLSGEVIAARRRLGYYYLGGGEDPAAAEIRSCTAESCMSRPVLVNADSNAYDAAVLLFTEDIGTLFVGKKMTYWALYPGKTFEICHGQGRPGQSAHFHGHDIPFQNDLRRARRRHGFHCAETYRL